MHKHTTAGGGVGGGGSGDIPPWKFLELRGYEIVSETILGLKQCFSEAR